MRLWGGGGGDGGEGEGGMSHKDSCVGSVPRSTSTAAKCVSPGARLLALSGCYRVLAVQPWANSLTSPSCFWLPVDILIS